MSGKILFLNNKSRQNFFAKDAVQKFYTCLIQADLENLKELLWFDINVMDLIDNQEIYGKPNVAAFFENLLFDEIAPYLMEINYGILPRDRPAILISYPLRPDYPNTEILVLKIIAHKIITIERSKHIPKEIIVAE